MARTATTIIARLIARNRLLTAPRSLRALLLPVSLLTVVGLLGVVFDARQRAFHDLAAKTAVVYDWGDRPAELPAPLSRWLTDHGVGDVTK